MTSTITAVGTRAYCARTIRKYSVDKELGIITNVKLTRVGFMVWHLQFDVEIKETK